MLLCLCVWSLRAVVERRWWHECPQDMHSLVSTGDRMQRWAVSWRGLGWERGEGMYLNLFLIALEFLTVHIRCGVFQKWVSSIQISAVVSQETGQAGNRRCHLPNSWQLLLVLGYWGSQQLCYWKGFRWAPVLLDLTYRGHEERGNSLSAVSADCLFGFSLTGPEILSLLLYHLTPHLNITDH